MSAALTAVLTRKAASGGQSGGHPDDGDTVLSVESPVRHCASARPARRRALPRSASTFVMAYTVSAVLVAVVLLLAAAAAAPALPAEDPYASYTFEEDDVDGDEYHHFGYGLQTPDEEGEEDYDVREEDFDSDARYEREDDDDNSSEDEEKGDDDMQENTVNENEYAPSEDTVSSQEVYSAPAEDTDGSQEVYSAPAEQAVNADSQEAAHRESEFAVKVSAAAAAAAVPPPAMIAKGLLDDATADFTKAISQKAAVEKADKKADDKVDEEEQQQQEEVTNVCAKINFDCQNLKKAADGVTLPPALAMVAGFVGVASAAFAGGPTTSSSSISLEEDYLKNFMHMSELMSMMGRMAEGRRRGGRQLRNPEDWVRAAVHMRKSTLDLALAQQSLMRWGAGLAAEGLRTACCARRSVLGEERRAAVASDGGGEVAGKPHKQRRQRAL